MKRKRLFTGLASLTLSLALMCPFTAWASLAPAAEAAEEASQATSAAWPEAPEIPSPSAILLEDTTNAVLMEQAADEVRSPGSIVKIMTVLLALENGSLTDEVTYSANAVAVVTGGAAGIGAKEGETMTLEQCLYAIMLGSANDASVQVAEQISGSVEAFVEKMNSRAAELGCTNTVFTNPTGLPDDSQHSTARDLALILQAAINNPNFCRISSAVSYTIPATNVSAARSLTNSFPLIKSGTATPYEGVLAGRSGYTQASGSTLAAAVENSGTRLICVLLAGADGQTAADAVSLFDYGFQNFQRLQYSDAASTLDGGFAILPNGALQGEITVEEATQEEGLYQEYYYGDRLVGHALLTSSEATPTITPEVIDNEDYLDSLTQEKSMVPYAAILGGGVILIALLGFLLRKVLKS